MAPATFAGARREVWNASGLHSGDRSLKKIGSLWVKQRPPKAQETMSDESYETTISSTAVAEPGAARDLDRTTDVAAAAYQLAESGLSVIPVNWQDKRPVGEWKNRQRSAMSADTVSDLVKRQDLQAIGIVGGKVSGGLLVIDFDYDSARFYKAWTDAVGADANGLPVVRTGKGFHVYLRCDAPGGNSKLAWAKSQSGDREIAIETKGEGGYVVAPPSRHPSRGSYTLISGQLDEIPLIDGDRLERLQEAARALSELPQTDAVIRRELEKHERRSASSNPSGGVIGPFNDAHDVAAILARNGYTILRDGTEFRRPGKDRGISGVIHYDKPGGRSVHFSSNDPLNDFKFGNGLCGIRDAFDVFTMLEQGGDVSRAVKEAAKLLGISRPRGSETFESIEMKHSSVTPATGTTFIQTKDELDTVVKLVDEPVSSRETVEGEIVDQEPQAIVPRVLFANQMGDVARAFLDDTYTHQGLSTIVTHRGQLYEWRKSEGRYAPIDNEDFISGQIAGWMERQQTQNLKGELIRFPVTPTTVAACLTMIRVMRATGPNVSEPPVWLESGESAKQWIAFKTSLLNYETGETREPSPDLFTVNAVGFDPCDTSVAPDRWLNFLRELWPNDPQQIGLLQEYMGYLLTCDTSQQKALYIHGPTRSGKGTIGRVIAKLIGKKNVATPRMAQFSQNFGCQQLLGKTVAVISDARFGSRDNAMAVEWLLNIIGEDGVSVPRKNLPDAELQLPLRFVFLSNDLPQFNDASGALAARFLLLRLTTSFLGREDRELEPKLTAELPAIFNWSLEGVRRLHERRYFVQPKAGEELVAEMQEISSPVLGFVRERCQIHAGAQILTADIYQLYREWCADMGIEKPKAKPAFARELMQVTNGKVIKRQGTSRAKDSYDGIGRAVAA